MKKPFRCFAGAIGLCGAILVYLLGAAPAFAATYYVDSAQGKDTNDGLSPAGAWQSLAKAGAVAYRSGDRLLLERGSVFGGTLRLRASGSAGTPVIVDAYGKGALPVIDTCGQVDGILIDECRFVEIASLEVTSDGGAPVEAGADRRRYGVRIAAGKGVCGHIHLRGLLIHDIFGEKPGLNPPRPTEAGVGIEIETSGRGTLDDIAVQDCRIERVCAFGIRLHGSRRSSIRDVRIADNRLREIGGPGIQATFAASVRISGNVVDGSGSSADGRMRGRGSCFWPIHCDDIVVEHNRLMHARGPGDSCGAHIDYDNRNVVIQYNLSLDNEGGFVEILGKDHDCCYRYNISVNDGSRIKGRNGAFMDGKTLWLSGYTGENQPKSGPFDSYIYNNTIYVKPGLRSAYFITRTSVGALIANNIFYVPGQTRNVGDDQDRKTLPTTAAVKGIVIENNLYLRAHELPPDLPLQDGHPLRDVHEIVGDPEFKNPGGSDPADYVPGNTEAVKHRGIEIIPLPGDAIGVKGGLAVSRDFFGHPITGLPDLGAVQLP